VQAPTSCIRNGGSIEIVIVTQFCIQRVFFS
jgi:hypothetical protein